MQQDCCCDCLVPSAGSFVRFFFQKIHIQLHFSLQTSKFHPSQSGKFANWVFQRWFVVLEPFKLAMCCTFWRGFDEKRAKRIGQKQRSFLLSLLCPRSPSVRTVVSLLVDAVLWRRIAEEQNKHSQEEA